MLSLELADGFIRMISFAEEALTDVLSGKQKHRCHEDPYIVPNDCRQQPRFAFVTDNVQLTRESNEGSMLEVKMPRLDESMRAGKLIEWLRKEGDRVKEGEPIAVVEGEKTTFEIEAPASGQLHKTLHPAGSEVPADEPIALIATDADAEHESARGHD